jgi:2-dehydropantoate 2-reductase
MREGVSTVGTGRTVAVLGVGGVGGFLAAALEHAGTGVTLVAREPTAAHLAAHGIELRSERLGELHERPAAVTELSGPVDVLVVATKATGLEAALERVRDAQPNLVIPLLNGLDHLALLRERFGTAAVAGTIRIEADRPRPGSITHTSPFLRVELASADPARRPALEAFAHTLQAADVPSRVLDSEAQVMWSKLVRLNALACATAAFDLPLGRIRDDPEKRAVLEGLVRETAAVARAEGAPIDPAEVMAELDEAHATLGSSMQRDIAAGREPELDAIPGAVLRAGARHGIDCPTIERAVGLIAARAAV